MGITEFSSNVLTDSVIEETDGIGHVVVTYANKATVFD